MTPSSLPPTYICPKCKNAFGEEAFITKTGKRARWCAGCRASHRQRLTSLNKKKAASTAKPILSLALVADGEGYAGHPLADLLALSHIAGAKRAVAIRDGKSWRGKKAWRAYFDAKRRLDGLLAEEAKMIAEYEAQCAAEPEIVIERNNNSEPVS